MDWYVVDKTYFARLFDADEKVGFIEYGDRLKLHVGVVLEFENTKYYLPISSPKDKHTRMSNGKDFHKIVDPKTNQLYAVININNMIPVPDECITQLKYNQVCLFRSFSSEKERTDYIYLLQKEIDIINDIADILKDKAQNLRELYERNPSSRLSQRCCNFPLLENIAKEYIKERET